MMASPLSESASMGAAPLPRTVSRNPLRLRARTWMFASAYNYGPSSPRQRHNDSGSPSSSLSAGIPCCRSTTACMPCRPPSPHLTRSSLHRCLRRHNISRLPEVEGTVPAKRKFKTYPLGYFHIDIAEVHTAQGKLYLLVAIDRTTKFAFVELHEKATRRIAENFLRALTKAVPYTIHTVLTDNGTHFTSPGNVCSAAANIRRAMDKGEIFLVHAFEYACAQNHIDHRLTKPRHPWANGQVERMNRTLKDATVERFHYETHDQLRNHLADLVNAYNFGRRLKTLKGPTPYEAICKAWTSDQKRFTINPLHQMPGLNISHVRRFKLQAWEYCDRFAICSA